MQTPLNMRVTELSRLSGLTKSAISMAMKNEDWSALETAGKRIVGIPPGIVHTFLTERGIITLDTQKLWIIATQVGGSGKSSTTLNLCMSALRLSPPTRPFVLIDSDSQSSLTLSVRGEPISYDHPVLVDWFDGKCTVRDMLLPTEIPNLFLLPSSLNNIYLDRSIRTPQQVKSKGLSLLHEIDSHFGRSAAVFVDTAPQLSVSLSTFIAAGAQMPGQAHLISPVRPDLHGHRGSVICITEASECLGAFNYSLDALRTTVFVNSYDQRTKSSVRTLTALSRDPVLSRYLAPVAIRYSTEVTKATYRQASVYNDYRSSTTIGQDYTDLLLSMLGHDMCGDIGHG